MLYINISELFISIYQTLREIKMMTFSKIGEEAYFYRVCFYLVECNIAQNQSFVQKGVGVKYIDYDYSPTQ